jgi:hypothetical protein
MIDFERALYNLKKTFKYEGNAPTNETEYNAMKENIEDAPTWAEVKFEMDNSITLKDSAKAKLIAGEPLTEEEADTIVL